jgi:hypothetical protein
LGALWRYKLRCIPLPDERAAALLTSADMRVRYGDEGGRPENLEQIVHAGGRLDRSVMEPTQGRSGRTRMDGVRPMQTRAHLPSEGQNWLLVC